MKQIKQNIAFALIAIVLFPIVVQTLHFVWSSHSSDHCCAEKNSQKQVSEIDDLASIHIPEYASDSCPICEYEICTKGLPELSIQLIGKIYSYSRVYLKTPELPYLTIIRHSQSRAPPSFYS